MSPQYETNETHPVEWQTRSLCPDCYTNLKPATCMDNDPCFDEIRDTDMTTGHACRECGATYTGDEWVESLEADEAAEVGRQSFEVEVHEDTPSLQDQGLELGSYES